MDLTCCYLVGSSGTLLTTMNATANYEAFFLVGFNESFNFCIKSSVVDVCTTFIGLKVEPLPLAFASIALSSFSENSSRVEFISSMFGSSGTLLPNMGFIKV